MATKTLVSDFDGTLTRHDFYALATSQLLPATTPNYWTEYRAGRMTHFEALRAYFAAIRADEATILQLVDQMEFDPGAVQAVAELRAAGWEIVVASAGCQWYIQRLLKQAGLEIEVYANPGQFQAGKGLLMELPEPSPFFSPTLGVDKAAVVKHYLASGYRVAFAGDGFPDVEAARLVPADCRFARGDLAAVVTKSGLAFQLFTVWSDIARQLIAGDRRP